MTDPTMHPLTCGPSHAIPMDIQADTYRVHYDSVLQTVTFCGELQLNGLEEYAPIMTLLDNVVEQEPSILTVDMRKLEFLNSSGINVLFRLVINVRQKPKMRLIVKGAESILWQKRTLQNLPRLMPAVEVQIQ